MMSNIETTKRFANLIETKDLNGLKDILADDFTAKGPSVNLNKQQTAGYLKVLFTAFPDMSFGLSDFEEKGTKSHALVTNEALIKVLSI